MSDVHTVGWYVEPAAVNSPDAAAVLREYFAEVVGRYHRRQASEAEVDAAMAEDPSTGLRPPGGRFLLLRRAAGTAGCVGVKLAAPGVAELTRMFVRPGVRGQGGGARLLGAAEDAARELGASTIRLDTRSDLIEARALYARHGYREVAPFSDAPYADHWFTKPLPPPRIVRHPN